MGLSSSPFSMGSINLWIHSLTVFLLFLLLCSFKSFLVFKTLFVLHIQGPQKKRIQWPLIWQYSLKFNVHIDLLKTFVKWRFWWSRSGGDRKSHGWYCWRFTFASKVLLGTWVRMKLSSQVTSALQLLAWHYRWGWFEPQGSMLHSMLTMFKEIFGRSCKDGSTLNSTQHCLSIYFCQRAIFCWQRWSKS